MIDPYTSFFKFSIYHYSCIFKEFCVIRSKEELVLYSTYSTGNKPEVLHCNIASVVRCAKYIVNNETGRCILIHSTKKKPAH